MPDVGWLHKYLDDACLRVGSNKPTALSIVELDIMESRLLMFQKDDEKMCNRSLE